MMPGQMDASGMKRCREGARLLIEIAIFGLLAFAIYMWSMAAIVYGNSCRIFEDSPSSIGGLLAERGEFGRAGPRHGNRA